MTRTQSRLGSRVLPWAGSLLILLILACVLVSASPELHRMIHSDADAADHNCAITLFAQGHVSSNLSVPLVAAFLFLFGGIFLLTETLVFASANYRFSSDRAPPAFTV